MSGLKARVPLLFGGHRKKPRKKIVSAKGLPQPEDAIHIDDEVLQRSHEIDGLGWKLWLHMPMRWP